MAWRKRKESFPGPLAEFHAEDWPPVEGECLTHYGCHGQGYSTDCVPREGEYCGQLHYESLARDYPDRPDLERAKLGDAYQRFHQARLAWVKDDDEAWMEEFLSSRYHEIRYGRPRS